MTRSRAAAPYLEWAKTRPAASLDLAGSNIFPCSIGDLPGALAAVTLQGRNDEGYAPLLEAIARHYDVGAEQVTTAQGASGANFLVCAALLQPGDEVLVETPGYDPLFAAPRLMDAHVNVFTRDFDDGFALDPERVRRAMTPKTRLVIVTNPHNPSGVLADPAALAEIGRIGRANDAHVLVDEVYLDLSRAVSAARERRTWSAAGLGSEFVCTNSLTKSYGLSGLRCGWIISSPDVTRLLRRARDVVDGTGSIVAERLAVHAFEHLDALLSRAVGILETNRPIVDEFLKTRAELECVAGSGTVVFPRLHGVADTTAFAERLLAERATAVVPGHFFQAPQHLRIGFGGDTSALRAGLQAIGAALAARG